MKMFNAGRRIVLLLAAFGLVMSVVPAALAAPAAAIQDTGGVRGENGQILRVTVKLNGKALKNVTAAITITTGDGKAVVSGVTSKAGTYAAPLDAGTYNVTATTTKYTATGSVTIEKSTSPAVLILNLELKTASAPTTTPQQ